MFVAACLPFLFDCSVVSYLDGAFRSMREERAHNICAGMRSWRMVEKVWPQKELNSDFRVGTSAPADRPCVALTCSACRCTVSPPAPSPGRAVNHAASRPAPCVTPGFSHPSYQNGDVILPRHCGGEQLTKTKTLNFHLPQCECA